MNKNKNEKKNVKRFEELELKDDFMFGVIMRNPKYCKPFLETILGIRISDIKYPRTQETIDLAADAKSVRLDVYVEDDKSTVYNIEMQVSINKNLPKRSRYYQGMIDLNILEKGGDYKDLKRSFVIFICTFDLFGKGRHIYTFENRCLQDYEIDLGDETTKIILNTKGTMNDVTPEMKRLLDYIDGQAASDAFTEELETAVKSVRSNEKWRVDYMTLEMHYREKYEEGVEDGIEQGLEQGIAQGLEQGLEQGAEQEKMQLAIKMLKAGKLSVAEISEYSGLPIEQITELKNEIFN
ncbi:MAG: Rpn family recombination-promoting nuclease/putative transposase [Bacteroides sp.]|nr:Rpn family recombination-promoting nuclease/putative transposase [Clostridium sp.]MCM1458919.1 Rpn family recombination-promoting nuclease/putative transposase [Bacteroides sp.]